MGVLSGIRVIEFANYVSGPYAGMLLADFGAEVIKIEVPGKGDPFRGWGRVDYSATFGSVNRNKKSIAIDLKQPEGRALVIKLCENADAVCIRPPRGIAPEKYRGAATTNGKMIAIWP